MASLSNLSKYLGVYKAWKDTVDNAGLRWLDGNSEDVVIDRFTRVRNPDEILKWVYTVKERVPSLSTFIDFAAFTGVRFVEAVNSYNLIIKLNQRLI